VLTKKLFNTYHAARRVHLRISTAPYPFRFIPTPGLDTSVSESARIRRLT